MTRKNCELRVKVSSLSATDRRSLLQTKIDSACNNKYKYQVECSSVSWSSIYIADIICFFFFFFILPAQPLLTSRKKKQSHYRSVISDIFDGSILSLVQCLTCDRVSSLTSIVHVTPETICECEKELHGTGSLNRSFHSSL